MSNQQPPGSADPDNAGAEAEKQSMQPNPETLLYLQALSLAIPTVSRNLLAMTTSHDEQATTAKAESEGLSEVLRQQVAHYVRDRTKMQGDIQSLKLSKTEVLLNVDTSKREFLAKKEEIRSSNATQLRETKGQVSHMDADRRESLAWHRDRAATVAKLERLNAQYEATEAAHKANMEKLTAAHESEKRHMRDTLIRRLRLVRDFVSSSTEAEDDEEGGGGDGAGNGGGDLAATLPSGPTPKMNERMARAVSLYEREAKTVVASIHQLTAELDVSKKSLEEQKLQNERLVLKNASTVKTRSVLLDQVADVAHRYQQAEVRLSDDQKLRKTTIADTAHSQSEILYHLHHELEYAIGEHERSQAKVRLLRHEQQKLGGVATEANRFFTETSMLLANSSSSSSSGGSGAPVKPPSAPSAPFSGSSSGGKKQPPLEKPFTTYPSAAAVSTAGTTQRETIPALLLTDPQDIAAFLSAALCS